MRARLQCQDSTKPEEPTAEAAKRSRQFNDIKMFSKTASLPVRCNTSNAADPILTEISGYSDGLMGGVVSSSGEPDGKWLTPQKGSGTQGRETSSRRPVARTALFIGTATVQHRFVS